MGFTYGYSGDARNARSFGDDHLFGIPGQILEDNIQMDLGKMSWKIGGSWN